MKKYWRWIVFGVVAMGLIALWLLLGMNKKFRQKIEALLLERKIKTEIQDLREKAAATKVRAENSEINAEEAEKEAKAIEEAIQKQKAILEEGLKVRGLSADEIANRFNNLDI